MEPVSAAIFTAIVNVAAGVAANLFTEVFKESVPDPRVQRDRERARQAVRLQDWYAYRPHPDRPVELYHALEDRKEERDLAADKPHVIEEVESIIHEAHAPTLYFPAPGKSRTEWEDRLRDAGIDLPENIDR